MANRTATILNRVCRQTDARQAHVADRDLLHRFATGHDQGAFATLVERHATMVFNVCRRYLSSVHDAEDACQATFLILVRQACQVRWQTSIANWLHTTARRVSARARRTTERRLKREARVAVRNSPSALDEISGRELLNILDEELGKLPAYYREAIVLCCLEGLSREEAADRIGVLEATLKTRLERGRRRLEAALIRRGVGLGVLLLATTSLGACPPERIENILSNAVGTPTPMVSILAREIPMSTLRNVLIATLGAFAVLGLGLGLHFAGPATANEKQPLPVAGQSVSVAFAPSAKAPADKFLENVAIARQKAIQFLIKQQTKEGNWEGTAFNLVADMEGGTTALVVLSLLEAGVPAKDPALAKAIDYLVTLPPKKTYVVSLQTQVLARADAKKHAVQIQKNADWLVDRAIGWKKDGKLEGWSYPGNSLVDGSNTHFAVMGLHAASATAKVDVKIWEAVRDHYVRTRKPGGWAYQNAAAPATESMTTAALVGLALVKKHDQASEASKEAMEKGTESLLAFSPNTGKSSGYQAWVVAELGRLIGSNEFKSGDKVVKWYRDGTERLLKNQQEDGSWAVGTGIDGNALMSTAFSLFFLGPVQK